MDSAVEPSTGNHVEGDIGITVEFARGEEMRTEISAKFRREGICRELALAGLELLGWFTDTADDYALILTRKP